MSSSGKIEPPARLFPFGRSDSQTDTDDERFIVFLVEDDALDRQHAVRTMEESPLIREVHCFESGDKLIAHFIDRGFYSGNLLRYVPILIILDIHVPGTGGIQILRELKAHPLTEDIPVVLLTGDPSEVIAQNARECRADALIAKPLMDLGPIHHVLKTAQGWSRRLPH